MACEFSLLASRRSDRFEWRRWGEDATASCALSTSARTTEGGGSVCWPKWGCHRVLRKNRAERSRPRAFSSTSERGPRFALPVPKWAQAGSL